MCSTYLLAHALCQHFKEGLLLCVHLPVFLDKESESQVLYKELLEFSPKSLQTVMTAMKLKDGCSLEEKL